MPSASRRELLATTAVVGLAGCTAARERVGDLRRGTPERRVDPGWRPGPGTWAERDYGPEKRRYSPHASPPRTDPVVAWERDLEEPPGDGWLVVADDTVFLATRRRLLAVDAADGTLRWEREIHGAAGLTYIDGRLYQLNWDLQEPDLVARSPDGDELWRTTVPAQITALHERDGYVFVGSRHRYSTLHADTGEIVRERDDPVRWAAFSDGSVYAALSTILVGYEIDGRTLEERWRLQNDLAPASGQPVVAGERIYVPQYEPTAGAGGVLVADADGAIRAEIELEYAPLFLTVTEEGPVVLPSSRGTGDLLAIRPDGSRRWTADVGGGASSIAANETVYAGSNPLVALDSDSGDRLWERDVDGTVGRLAAADSTLYVATADRLLALRA